ncbi:hypothetical protein [Sphingomonas parva]|uniref:hypothetical protein n=1 Tax=Sphingomonas parva TaxID=2555898 RepID=UPI0017829FCC|nr:hypothetical protein [Sphingomonas parva]
MPVFVHLTSHRNVPAIRRGGIRFVKKDGWRRHAIYALPVTRDFQISHQWLRELRRTGGGTIVAIYFRIPDEEIVRVGHFDKGHVEMTAAEAAALMLEAEKRPASQAREADRASRAVRERRRMPASPEGFEVLLSRAIGPAEILRVKAMPQVVGWRYRPGANGEPPCTCICCERGSWGIQRLQRAVEAAEAAGRKPRANLFGRSERSFRRGRVVAASGGRTA